MTAEDPAPRPPLRSNRGQGRSLLLSAAQDLFTRSAYRDVTTKDIAARAGVTEQMIFRHFGSKSALFQEAALTPFIEHLVAYMDDWEASDLGSRPAGDLARDLLQGLFTVFRENRRLATELMQLEFEHDDAGPSEAIQRHLGPALTRLSTLLASARETSHLRDFNPAVVVRLIAGLAISQAVFRNVLYVAEDIADSEIIQEMVDLTLRGLGPGMQLPHADE